MFIFSRFAEDGRGDASLVGGELKQDLIRKHQFDV